MNSLRSILVLSSIFLFAACKKDATRPNNNGNNNGNNTPAKTKKELLTDAKWQTIADVRTGTVAGKDTTIDAYATYGDCLKDDFMIFEMGGAVVNDKGAIRCTELTILPPKFEWALLNNDTQLQYANLKSRDTTLYEILELTPTQLKIMADNYTENGVTYTQMMTMKNIK